MATMDPDAPQYADDALERDPFAECAHGVRYARTCGDCEMAAEIDAIDAEVDALMLDAPGDPGLTRWPAGLEDALDLLHEQRAALLALGEDGAA